MTNPRNSSEEKAISSGGSIVILTAVYNDWDSLLALLPFIDDVLAAHDLIARIVVVDDGSSIPVDWNTLESLSLNRIQDVTAVTLTRNLGNQRAIAVGVAYIAAKLPCDYLLIMDSDHEDKPEYIPHLLHAASASGEKIIFAERTIRSEGLLFRAFYRLYQRSHRALTGLPISFGNFSVIPGRLVQGVANISELWNHYPASIMRARIPFDSIPSIRGRRLIGKSKINLVSLIVHGLSSLAVHADVVGVRILIGMLLLLVPIGAGIVISLMLRLLTDIPQLGWTSQFVSILIVMSLQVFTTILLLIFVIHVIRSQRPVIPSRDYEDYVLNTVTIYTRSNAGLCLPHG